MAGAGVLSIMRGGFFVMYRQEDDGSKGHLLAQGSLSAISRKVRLMQLRSVPDPAHPLGVFYLGSDGGIYVVDFELDD